MPQDRVIKLFVFIKAPAAYYIDDAHKTPLTFSITLRSE